MPEVRIPVVRKGKPIVKPKYVPLLMKDVLKHEGTTGFNVASTFSGAGGSCTGYRLAGFNVRWANEFEPTALKTYKMNCQEGCVADGRDIRTVKGSSVFEATGIKHGELDLFDGSPPCQSFSSTGLREKGWGKTFAHGDGTNQRSDDLFEEYIRLIKELQPKTFVAENVTGLIKGAAKGYFKMVLAWMKEAGYDTQAAVIDSRWLGVPQARQRVIFVGVRNDIAQKVIAKVGKINRYPTPNDWYYSVADACPWIGRKDGKTRLDCKHPICEDPIEHAEMELGVSGKIAWGECPIGSNHPINFNCTRVDERFPCPTINAAHGCTTMHGIAHPYEPRRFTILEVKRICSFPDDFKMTGTFAERWTRLGNAVPPLMMHAIASAIRDNVLVHAA